MTDHITPVEKRLNCHGSQAKVRCNTFPGIGRLLALFRTRFILLAAAALLVALTVMRKEEALELIFRNDSDPGLSKNKNLSHSDRQQQLQQPSNQQELQEQQQQSQQRQPQPMNWKAFNIALHEAQKPVNWTWRQMAEKQKTKSDFNVLKIRLQSQFMKLKEVDEILSYQELGKRFRPLLQEKGLLMVGDSTTRLLFGTLWCLMDGIFPSDGDNDWKVCNQRQNEMKEKCRSLMDSGENCELTIPTFANKTTNLHLQFQRNWRIGKLPNNTVEIMADNRDRFIFFMFPCLHELWTPWGQETDAPEYPDWNSSFDDLFTSVERANPEYAFLLGTTVAVCDSKLWNEELIKMYLHHGGALKCTSVGLEVLSQHSLLTNPTVKVLDMHDATERSGCNDAPDGRHYNRGLAPRRQLTLLWKAMQNAPKR